MKWHAVGFVCAFLISSVLAYVGVGADTFAFWAVLLIAAAWNVIGYLQGSLEGHE